MLFWSSELTSDNHKGCSMHLCFIESIVPNRLWCRLKDHVHPAAGDGLWGSQNEVPSFLYAMPSSTGHVFLEETCLVAKPALPFATLKRRLHRRMDAMGLKVGPLICSCTSLLNKDTTPLSQ